MFAQVIEYEDFDGNTQKEEVRLNLTKVEVKELDLKYESEGGLIAHLKKLIGDPKKAGDNVPQKPMYDFFKEIIELSYGKKSDDGRRFMKYDRDGYRLAYEFMDSACFYKLFEMSLTGELDPEKLIMAIFPDVPPDELAKTRKEVANELGLDDK